MGDKELFNTRERALSGDLNDLQTIASTMLGEYLANMGAERFYGSGFPSFRRSWSRGLYLIGDGLSGALLTPGVLMQESPTNPGVPSSIESNARLATLRGNLAVALPSPGADTYYLLEAQVVDTVTLNTPRDVFDVPTQTFIPTAVDKQTQRRIQTQLVAGSATDLPSPTGDPWVPMFGLLIPSGGFGPLDNNAVIDLRNMWDDGQNNDSAGGAFVDDATARDARFATANSYHTPVAGNFVGGCDIRGHGGGFEYMFNSRAGFNFIAPLEEVGFALAADTLVHFYLAAVAHGAFATAPRQQAVGTDPILLTQGVLVASLNQPFFGGRSNFAPLALPAPWSNWNAGITAGGTALHVGSAMVNSAGTDLVPMEQGTGGDARLDSFPADTANAGLLALSFFSAALVNPTTAAISLVGKVPDNVKSVDIHWAGLNAAGAVVVCRVRGAGGGPVITQFSMPSGAVAFEFITRIGVNHNNLSDFGRVFEIEFSTAAAGSALALEGQVVGWQI